MTDKTMDDSDLAAAGLLPKHPADDCEDIPTPPADSTPQQEAAPMTWADMLAKAKETIAKRKSGCDTLPTPWRDLNNILGGGLLLGNLYVLVGNTGGGKTQFALALANHAASNGNQVVYYALELDSTELVCRLAAIQKRGISWQEVNRGKGDDTALDGVLLDNLTGVFPPPGSCLTLPVGGGAPKLVIVDFLQLLGSSGQDERQAVKAAAYQLREYSRVNNVAVLVLSSTARDNYKLFQLMRKSETEPVKDKPDGKPGLNAAEFLGAAKESGEIEHAATAVLALVRKRSDDWPNPNPVWVAVAKNRMGRTDWALKLEWNGNRFTEAVTAGTSERPPNV